MILLCGLLEPIGRLLQILRTCPSLHIGLGEIIGCQRMPLLAAASKKSAAFFSSFFTPRPLASIRPSCELRVHIARDGALRVPLGSFDVVLTDAKPFSVKLADQRIGLDLALCRCLSGELERRS